MRCNLHAIPVAWLRERYSYDVETGVIRFKTGHSKMLGMPAGCLNDEGYRIIRITYQGKRRQVMAHRLGWTLHTGEHPELDIDHRDNDRDNNRLGNLRHATRSQNLANRPNTGELPKGVTLNKRSKANPYQAQITAGGSYRYLGSFPCPTSAHNAYLAAAGAAFGEFVRT